MAKTKNKLYQLVVIDRHFVVYLKVSIRAITFYTNYPKHIVVPQAENGIAIHISMHISYMAFVKDVVSHHSYEE